MRSPHRRSCAHARGTPLLRACPGGNDCQQTPGGPAERCAGVSRLHEMTGDIAWLRRSVEILSEAASAPGVGVAEVRVILQDRLSVLEQIATLTGDQADVVTGIQAACALLRSAYGDEPRATVRGGGARLPARRTN